MHGEAKNQFFFTRPASNRPAGETRTFRPATSFFAGPLLLSLCCLAATVVSPSDAVARGETPRRLAPPQTHCRDCGARDRGPERGWCTNTPGTNTQACAVTYCPPTVTDVPSDLAIEGAGFFVLRDPANGNLFATRLGAFGVDVDGYLVTTNGLRLQGCNDAVFTTIGDLRIDTEGAPPSDTATTVTSYAFDSEGKLQILLGDGTYFIRGQVLLESLAEPCRLMPCGAGQYTNLAAADRLGLAAPGTNGMGTVVPGALEICEAPEHPGDDHRPREHHRGFRD